MQHSYLNKPLYIIWLTFPFVEAFVGVPNLAKEEIDIYSLFRMHEQTYIQ